MKMKTRNVRETFANYPERLILKTPRRKAEREGKPFEMTSADVVIPEICPILGIPLLLEGSQKNRPTLVLIDENGPYTKDNTRVVSNQSQYEYEKTKLSGIKTCPKCGVPKPLSEFPKDKKKGFYSTCKRCKNLKYQDDSIAARLLYGAQTRANSKGIPCTIVETDVLVPDTCPVLGIPIIRGIGKLCQNSPTIDCLRPELGYVPGNINVISFRANTIKNNATLEELETVTAWVRRMNGRPTIAKAPL